MISKIRKWGNSLALRIPKSFARQALVESGSEVDLAIERDRLVIRPLRPRRYRLKRLLAAVTKRNLHAGVETGAPVGRESL